jgi:hypothetical protein
MQKDGFPNMKFISLLLLFSSGYASEYAPWFPPPWEFQGRVSYLYEQVEKVRSPQGSFRAPSNNSSIQLSLDVTCWPYWNVEGEVFLTRTSDIDFAYEAALFTLRYAWLDDISGDCISLITGATLSFPVDRFLHEFSFDYHGNANAEFHATVGKEWARCEDWLLRLWGLGGLGIANRGSPWVHGLGVVECKPFSCLAGGLFSEAVYGLGHQAIIPDVPFEGYASINHQAVDVGGYVTYDIRYLGTLTLLGWYNVHARNFIERYWGGGISLLVPFSVF